MPRALHNPQVPGILLTPARFSQQHRCASAAEFSDALDVIHAAVANLRLYRDRLTLDDYSASLQDIEHAAAQISRGAAREAARIPAKTRNTKRGSR
jgi:hypothetical protein